MDDLKERALKYHEANSCGGAGKISVEPIKPCASADDLTLAYTPGVAQPVLSIAENEEDSFRYTSRGNLVAVVSNGSAILGLGNRGAAASKPVMEGKGVLFKRFADIDVFDLELDTADPEEIIRTVEMLQPTFGGINLEDIKAPECFHIEETLIKKCDIPVFHDDQHGTAIIATAGLLNACEITGRDIGGVRMVVNGAGAAGVACARMFINAGVKKEMIVMCDSKGVINSKRGDLNSRKQEWVNDSASGGSLADAVKGSDCFIGVSGPDTLTPEMLLSMNDRPMVFAMANPDPEIRYDLAIKTRSDLIMATGRSDHPNQINNVLGFPFIFRGALDVRATAISEGMKMAAARSLAALSKEPVPDEVRGAYGRDFSFGPDYIVPKPFDPRVIEWEAVAVAKAACGEGLARRPISDYEAYANGLRQRMKRFW